MDSGVLMNTRRKHMALIRFIAETLVWLDPIDMAWPAREDILDDYQMEAEELADALLKERPQSPEDCVSVVRQLDDEWKIGLSQHSGLAAFGRLIWGAIHNAPTDAVELEVAWIVSLYERDPIATSSGEYARNDWNVRVFRNEDDARAFAATLSKLRPRLGLRVSTAYQEQT